MNRNLALHDLSRYIIAATLIPVLQASTAGGGGVVLDILAAGVWNEMDPDNMELNGKKCDFFREWSVSRYSASIVN